MTIGCTLQNLRDDGMDQKIKIIHCSLPETIRGAALQLPSGRHVIFINQDLPEADQRHALNHEMAHINLDHFTDARPIQEVEIEANAAADQAERAVMA